MKTLSFFLSRFVILLLTLAYFGVGKSEVVSDYAFHRIKLTPEFIKELEEQKEQWQQRQRQAIELSADDSKPDVDGEDTPLYQELMKEIFPDYKEIGAKETDDIIKYNKDFDLGEKNFSGFNWQLPKGTFTVGANRQVAPDVYKEGRWIIQDRFTISIEATTYLDNLKKEKRVAMSDTDIAAFAGLVFQRTYTYYHYADSYLEGLISDYSKLFLSFMMFRKNMGMLRLSPYEIVNKEDYLAIQGGAAVKVPPNQYHIDGQGGILVTLQLLAKVSVQRLGEEDKPVAGEFLRVSMEKKRGLDLGISAEVSSDYLKLLELTILTFDLTYNLDDERNVYLHFFESDKNELGSNQGMGAELQKLVMFQIADVNVFKDRLVSAEKHIKSGLDAKYKVLLAGGLKKSDSEYIKITKDGENHIFFRGISRSVFYVKSILEKIFNVLSEKLSLYAFTVKYLATWEKLVEIEYEGVDKVVSTDHLYISPNEKVSLHFMQEYQAQQSKLWIHRPLRNYAVDFMARYTTLDESVTASLEKNTIFAPLILRSHIRVGKEGLDAFNAKTVDEVLAIIDKSCSVWFWGKEFLCDQVLKEKYKFYQREFVKKGDMSFFLLKGFLVSFQRFAHDLDPYKELFGEKNVFVYGGAKTNAKKKKSFQTYFYDGYFQGLGVVDDFIRSSDLKYPIGISF